MRSPYRQPRIAGKIAEQKFIGTLRPFRHRIDKQVTTDERPRPGGAEAAKDFLPISPAPRTIDSDFEGPEFIPDANREFRVPSRSTPPGCRC